ncbi:MAG: sporulation integral membrane protein YlbJ [Firmicutes bacterium]|nr:sporulation integral membrane protein YlbJ [Bacillota bacterium]NLL88136.1 sporulation integral membrane protein YlbJ [Bacillota bacterium]
MGVKNRLYFKVYATAALGFSLALALVVFPKTTFQASLDGLRLWFEVVLPALLPFFVMAELLINLGVIQFLGTLLEPVMYPLFRIPGAGAFAVALGLASGYPLGAKITADLRRRRLISRIEAERLVCFANTAGPLFIAGAVSVGMLGLPETAILLLLAHYLSTIMVGFLMRCHGSGRQETAIMTNTVPPINLSKTPLAYAAADITQIGSLLYDAVIQSFKSLAFVGGCIMVFSVLARILDLVGIIPAISDLFTSALAFVNINRELTGAVVTGLLEIDIGIQAITLTQAALLQKLVTISAIIGWSGLSVHAQVAAMIQGTDIRIKPYIIARALHAVCAGITAALLYNPVRYFWEQFGYSLPVIANISFTRPSITTVLSMSLGMAALLGGILVFLGLFAWIINRIVVLRIKP